MRIMKTAIRASIMGGFFIIGGVMTAPAVHAVVPCTFQTAQGRVTASAPTMKSCLMQLLRSDAAPDGKGWVYGQFGSIRLAASARHSWRYYDDTSSWSALQGYPGRLPAAPATAAAQPSPSPAANSDVAPAQTVGRPSFAEALTAALESPAAVTAVEDPHGLGGPGSLDWSISQFGFLRHIQGPKTCGVWVAGRWYRMQSPSKPHCAVRLAQLAREVSEVRTVKATWSGEPLWLGTDAVYVEDDDGRWVAWASF